MMKKRFILGMAAAFMACAMVFAGNNAEAKKSDVIIKKGVLKEYSGNAKTYTVPENVKKISIKAFEKAKNLENIVIKKNVNKISDKAFEGAKKLTKITVTKNNKKYASFDGAIYSKDMKKLIKVPEARKSINIARESEIYIPTAFSYSSVTSVTIGENCFDIGERDDYTFPFGTCKQLKEIKVNEQNKYFKSVDGVLFSRGGTRLIHYPENKAAVERYDVPDGVVEIIDGALLDAQTKEISVPHTLKRMGVINDDIKNIIFRGNNQEPGNEFRGVFLKPEGVSLTFLDDNFTLPASWVVWRWFQFGQNTNPLQELTIVSRKDSATHKYAVTAGINWKELTAETEANMPMATPAPTATPTVSSKYDENLIKSGIYTYRVVDEAKKEIELRGVDSTEYSLVLPGEIDGYKVVSIGYCGWVETDEIIVESLQLKGYFKDNTYSVIIPEGVREIGPAAFYGFHNLVMIYLPDSLEYIRPLAFAECSRLCSEEIGANVKLIQDEAFRGCNKLENVEMYCSMLGDKVFPSNIKSLTIKASGNNIANIGSALTETTIDTLIIDEKIKEVSFEDAKFSGNVIKKMYVNGPDTKITSGKNGAANIKVKHLYTVSGAESIAWAKKEKTTYTIKTAKNVKNVVKKKDKKNKEYYVYSWDATDTTEKTFVYNKKAGKWKKNMKQIETCYAIYVKKSGKYAYHCRTTETSQRLKKKDVKIIPYLIWEEAE